MSIGCIGLILYNNYRSLYNTLINYVFVLYEFMLLLFVSNRSWRYEILNSQYDDNDMCIFIFLLFSSPTILYVAYNFFQKHNLDKDDWLIYKINLIFERTKEVLKRVKAEGKYIGRPVDRKSAFNNLKKSKERILQLAEQNIPKTQIARMFKVDRSTIRRFINQFITN